MDRSLKRAMAHRVQAALGGDLLAVLRHHGDHVRPRGQRNLDDPGLK